MIHNQQQNIVSHIDNIFNKMQDIKNTFLRKSMLTYVHEELAKIRLGFDREKDLIKRFHFFEDFLKAFYKLSSEVITNVQECFQFRKQVISEQLKVLVHLSSDSNSPLINPFPADLDPLLVCLLQIQLSVFQMSNECLSTSNCNKQTKKPLIKNLINLIFRARVYFTECNVSFTFEELFNTILTDTLDNNFNLQYFECIKRVLRQTDLQKLFNSIEARISNIKHQIYQSKPKINFQLDTPKANIDTKSVKLIKPLIEEMNQLRFKQQHNEQSVRLLRSNKMVPRTIHHVRQSMHRDKSEKHRKKSITPQECKVEPSQTNFKSRYFAERKKLETDTKENADRGILLEKTPQKRPL